MAKPVESSNEATGVRTRRAYFDCRYGQLHVRTAFPTTGGFDEGTTLICLHPEGESGRAFDRFLPEIADARSVYAPDLPGCGESDPVPAGRLGHADAACAVVDLARDLRLRQIDLLGFRFGAGVALQLAVTQPQLVRRLVLLATPPMEGLPSIPQVSLVMRIKLGSGDDSDWARGTLPHATFTELSDYTADLFDAAPKVLSRTIGEFLQRQA